MKHLLTFLKKDWPVLGILFISLVLALTNYSRGTFLTGWDNLHPEFNFPMNIYRSLFAVWQEYQGVGLLGGMAHASDLPRQLFLWLTSLVIPQSFLRYFYHFLMLPVGMLGIYFLLKNIFLKDISEPTRKISSLMGSLFYLLNLGTIQYFYVPFEPYSTFWGIFPWEIYTLLRFLEKKDKKSFIFFVLANIAGIAQAYVQTIFLVYMLCVGVILGFTYLENKSRRFLKTIGVILGTIFVINAFWLLPNLYFVATNLSVTQDAMQNQMATEKFFQMNRNRGTLQDLPLLKEFYFDFFDFDNQTGSFDYLMKVWRDHFSHIPVQLAGYILFGISVLGILVNTKHRKAFFGLSALCLIIFLSSTPGISLLNDFFRFIPIVNQIFRNPFTKFIVPLVTLFALGVGMGLAYLSMKAHEAGKSSLLPALFAFLLIGVTSYPVFQGQFFSPSMKVEIPQSYFRLFEYFEHQDKNARIMNLPQGSFWGWYYYRWGVRGSGFLWYGIEQPILDRAFDVWSRKNEDYYWELSYALQKRDQHLFNSLLEKYQIEFVLFDKSILFADNINTVRYAYNQEALIENNDKLSQDASFGDVTVYKVALTNHPRSFVIGSTTPPKATTPPSSLLVDNVFQSVGLYQNRASSPSIIYPYEGLFTGRTVNERSVKTIVKDQKTSLTTSVPAGEYRLTLPAFSKTATLLPLSVEGKKSGSQLTLKFTLLEPSLSINGQTFQASAKTQEIVFPVPSQTQSFILGVNNTDFFEIDALSSTYQKIGTTYLENSEGINYLRLYQGQERVSHTLSVTSFDEGKICGQQGKNTSASSGVVEQEIRLNARNTANCTVFKTPFNDLHDALIKTSLTYESTSDEFPQFCYYSESTKSCLNAKDTLFTGHSQDKATLTDYFENPEDATDKGYFHLILEAQSDEDKDQHKTISYSDISLTAYPYIAGVTIPLSGFDDDEITATVTVAEDSDIQIDIPTPSSRYAYLTPVRNSIYKTSALNYDKALPGEYDLEVLKINPTRLRTSAQEASSYLLFRANNLQALHGYLLSLTTDHQAGFPFTVNLFTNEEFRSYAYTFASKEKNVTTQYFVLPPLYAFDQGISVLLGSNSYNSSPSINDLIDLSLTPLPYTYITSLTLQRPSDIRRINTTDITTDKKSLSTYVITPSHDTQFLTLSQGYDSGWQAYQVKRSTWQIVNKLKETLPFFFGKRLEHVMVNNWENGWVLPHSEAHMTVVVTYIPQLTEFLGFFISGVLLLGGLLTLLYKKAKKTTAAPSADRG